MADIKIQGRVFIEMEIKAVTGLHIGGSSEGLEIGGLDNAVIRNPLTKRPYIPGSSLKGKMRSQSEKIRGLPQNKSIGSYVTIHSCETPNAYNNCAVCQVFGVSASEKETLGPTRLLVRDAELSDKSAERLTEAQTDLPYAELKTEVAIDRVTSAATPRTLERVPAGAIFDGAELVYSIYQPSDIDNLEVVIDALQLVEDDYLGGSGSRGSGKVQFTKIKVYARNGEKYSKKQDFKEFDSLQELSAASNELKNWLKQNIINKNA